MKQGVHSEYPQHTAFERRYKGLKQVKNEMQLTVHELHYMGMNYRGHKLQGVSITGASVREML